MNTLLLNLDGWDLCVDANGNIAMASEPYSYLQDAASVCRVWLAEYYYNTDLGVPYLQLLGQVPIPFTQIRNELVSQALTVPDIPEDIQLIFGEITDRRLVAQLQVKAADGSLQSLNFTVTNPRPVVTDDGQNLVTNDGQTVVVR